MNGKTIEITKNFIRRCLVIFLSASSVFVPGTLAQAAEKEDIPGHEKEETVDVTSAATISAPDTLTAYVIEPGDVLEIVILGEEELSRTLMVMHNGTISFPLIGEVLVGGLTTEQAAGLLAEKLKGYFTHPVISVILKSPTTPHVSVFGEVQKPGAVEYQRGLRVTDYIALCGGPAGAANLKKVKVIRYLEGSARSQTVNVERILKKGDKSENFELKSGDWIYIGKRFSINWGLVISTLTLAVAALNLYITIQRL